MATIHAGLRLEINDRFRDRSVKFFNNFTLNMAYNKLASTFSFDFYFDPDNIDLKELACVGHYHPCKIYYNDQLLVTGVMLSESFSDAPARVPMKIAGYSLPGVFTDCSIPPDMSLQSDGLSLREIVKRFTDRFGLTLVVDSIARTDSSTALVAKKTGNNNGVKDAATEAAYAKGNTETDEEAAGKPLKSTTASHAQIINSYLSELATQKNIVLTHNARGNVVITEANTKGKPILDFDTTTVGGEPGTTFGFTFNGAGMHSHIYVQKQSAVDPDSDQPANAGYEYVRNPYVINSVYRSRTEEQSSGDDVDTIQYAKNILAEELKNLTWTITTDRWLVDNKLITANNIITVKNPAIYLFNKTRLFIESIDMKGDEKSNTVTLNLVLPEVYSKEMPTYLFDGINLH